MSVVPLRFENEGKASSKHRDLPGTVNIPFGYRLSQPGQNRRNVNANRPIKQSRLTHIDKSPTAKFSKNPPDHGISRDVDPVKNKSVSLTPAKVKAKSQRVESSRVKVSSKSVEGKSGGNVKVSSIEEKGRSRSEKYPAKEEKRISILPVDTSPSNDEDIAREEREYNSFLRTFHFVERTDKRILRNKFRNLLDEGLSEYERSIDSRREKLRELLLTEDRSVMREVIEQAQRGDEQRMAETQRRTEELRRRLEEQRLATIAEKRRLQCMTECPEFRTKFSRKTALETKYSNLAQMAENEAKRQAEREIDVMWYDLMLRECEAKKLREIEDERRRLIAGKSIVATLDKQIAGKMALDEEERRLRQEESVHLAKLSENARREESSNPARERDKRLQLRRDLEAQLSTARRYREERIREEDAAERAFRALNAAELSRERAETRDATSRQRAELVAYAKSLEELRREEARRNREIEKIVSSSAREIESRRDLERKKARDARDRSLRELIDGREQQLRLKESTIEEENRREAMENELGREEAEAEAQLMAKAEMRRREMAQRYGEELIAQRNNDEERRRRECDENERILREERERQREQDEIVEEMLNAPDIITPHAFSAMLKECAAIRRENQQKGLCYCSPSRPNQQMPDPFP